jgi:hypothetical protein
MQDQGSKSIHARSTMITLTKVQNVIFREHVNLLTKKVEHG